jgi:hypothetical protein
MEKLNLHCGVYPGGLCYYIPEGDFLEVAFISRDREIRWNKDIEIPAENKKEILEIANNGNVIGFSACDNDTLVLEPIGPRKYYHYNPVGHVLLLLTVEEIGGKKYICCGDKIKCLESQNTRFKKIPYDYEFYKQHFILRNWSLKTEIRNKTFYGTTEVYKVVKDFPDGAVVWKVGRENFPYIDFIPLGMQDPENEYWILKDQIFALDVYDEEFAHFILHFPGDVNKERFECLRDFYYGL